MTRVVFKIKPNWDAGYDIHRDGSWVGSAMTRESIRQLAFRLADEIAVTGRVALIALEDGNGEIVSVEWVDPPVTIPEIEHADPS
jgi:hypothetical protein